MKAVIALLAFAFLASVASYKRTTAQPECNTVNCFVAPCTNAKCDAVPGAVCEDDYCNGCNTKWSYGGQDVTARCKLGADS